MSFALKARTAAFLVAVAIAVAVSRLDGRLRGDVQIGVAAIAKRAAP